MHLEVDQKYYLRQKKVDGLVPPVLDSLDNYKMLSERMNVLELFIFPGGTSRCTVLRTTYIIYLFILGVPAKNMYPLKH